MTAKKKVGKRVETPRLTRDDWLDAAFNAVVEGGFDKARVLMIADTLGVTRGSFYWHFADHAELIAALLARWYGRELALDQQLRSDAHSKVDPKADLEQLLEVALAHAGADLENIRFELALRGLGRRDATVAQMLVQVDQARMGLFEQKFLRLTSDKKKSSELAALFYLAIVGSYQALSRPMNPPQVSAYLSSIISTYLIHQQAPVLLPSPARRRSGAKAV
jgi:AcrR family transcriptional regulator